LTGKTLVKQALQFKNPERVPLVFINCDRELSDIIMVEIEDNFGGPGNTVSEWGFHWEKQDATMGQVTDHILKTDKDIYSFTAPDPASPERFKLFNETREKFGRDKYYIGSLGLSGFTIMTLLRGFNETLIDLYSNRKKPDFLADTIFNFEEEIIRRTALEGADGIALYDDWGSQSSLIINPVMWREYFKPRYKRQCDIAHKHGLDVYFHSCGYIYDIIQDLIDIGVDMLNLGQPNLYDIEALGKDFGGSVCFVCPVSYQTTLISGTKEDIFEIVHEYIHHLGGFNGGLIGYIEEYSVMGMSDENYRSCIEAFSIQGVYET